MVKGITRRVIVVKSPDPRYFEEAIFIVKEEVSLQGVDADTVLREAQSVASGYIRREAILGRISPLGYLAVGAGLTAAVLALMGVLA